MFARLNYFFHGLALVFKECLILGRDLYSLLYKDPLTSLMNYQALTEAGRRAEAFARRRGEWLSVVMIDLDDFKSVNDLAGHDVGDEVLADFALVMQKTLRCSDVLGLARAGRRGGDEFVLVLPGADWSGAEAVMRRLKLASEVVAFSYGISSVRFHRKSGGMTFEEMLECADHRMYEQKREKGAAR